MRCPFPPDGMAVGGPLVARGSLPWREKGQNWELELTGSARTPGPLRHTYPWTVKKSSPERGPIMTTIQTAHPTCAAQNEARLRRIAHERVKHHLLPAATDMRLWAGPGTGGLCALCGEPVGPEQIEYEVDEPGNGTVRTFRLHVRCHAAWLAELTDLRCSRHDSGDSTAGLPGSS